MVEHLRSSGYRRIAHITGPDGNYESGKRLRGYRAALALADTDRGLVFPGSFTEESGDEAGRRIAASAPLPDAVFAANDMMAIGCLFALTEAGLRVPQDIALAGFDDIPIARFVTPPLTTVRAPTTELGRLALEELANAIERPDGVRPTRHALATQLGSAPRALRSPAPRRNGNFGFDTAAGQTCTRASRDARRKGAHRGEKGELLRGLGRQQSRRWLTDKYSGSNDS